jgi:hypothetical protein
MSVGQSARRHSHAAARSIKKKAFISFRLQDRPRRRS